MGGSPGTRLGSIVPSCEIAITDQRSLCVERVRNREKREIDGQMERDCEGLYDGQSWIQTVWHCLSFLLFLI